MMRRATIGGIVLVGLLLCAGRALAGDHFVSSNGTETTWSNCVDVNTNHCTLAVAAANAAAGDTVYLKNDTDAAGAYDFVLTAQLAIARQGTAAAPIIWEPYTTTAGDWDGTPGQLAIKSGDFASAIRLQNASSFNEFRGIKIIGTQADHYRGFWSTGTCHTFYRCVVYGTSSTAYKLAGVGNWAIQCEADHIGLPDDGGFENGVGSFASEGMRSGFIGCYAHDGYGTGFWFDEGSLGYDVGAFGCIAARIRSDGAAGTTQDGSGFWFGATAEVDTIADWVGYTIASTGTQRGYLVNCVAVDCNNGVKTGGPDPADPAQPLLVMNSVVSACTNGIVSISTNGTAALEILGLGLYDCNIATTGLLVTTRTPNTVFTSSPFVNAAANDFRMRQMAIGWPTQFVVGGELSSWLAYPQLGAAPKKQAGSGTRSMGIGL